MLFRLFFRVFVFVRLFFFNRHHLPMGLVALACLLLLLPAATPQPTNQPQTCFDTGTPPDAFGTDGFDVSSSQAVAQRFYNNVDGPLSRLEVWFMADSAANPRVNISIFAGGSSAPPPAPATPLEIRSFTVPGAGFSPQLITLNSTATPELAFGSFFWVTARSAAPPGSNAAWCESNTIAWGATTDATGAWQPGGSGNAAAVKVVLYQPPMAGKTPK